jgi:hypothetical protein
VAIWNGQNTRSYVAEYTIASGEANTDVIKSVTLTLDTTTPWPTDNTAGFSVLWVLMAGSIYQAAPNTWVANAMLGTSNQFNFMGTAGNVFELFDVSLTEGTVAPPFRVPDYADELAACQRYWQKSYNYVNPPGTAIGTGVFGVSSVAGAEAYFGVSATFPIRMRATPTVILWDGAGTAARIGYRVATVWANGGTHVATTVSESNLVVVANNIANCTGIAFHYTANARL